LRRQVQDTGGTAPATGQYARRRVTVGDACRPFSDVTPEKAEISQFLNGSYDVLAPGKYRAA